MTIGFRTSITAMRRAVRASSDFNRALASVLAKTQKARRAHAEDSPTPEEIDLAQRSPFTTADARHVIRAAGRLGIDVDKAALVASRFGLVTLMELDVPTAADGSLQGGRPSLPPRHGG